jgi:hypothetical protein
MTRAHCAQTCVTFSGGYTVILPSGETRRSHWIEHAATWDHFGPPLRPHPLDMDRVQAVCAARCGDAPRALLLGVTPEYALLPWPAATSFTAVDKCADMINKVWPANRLPASFRALEGQWTDLPLPDQSVDLAMGDGISTVLPHWSLMDRILGELRRVCAPGSTVILRLFVKPDAPDSLEQLMEDLEVGRIQGFHAFKLRLLMLLQRDLGQGVQPRQAWETWHSLRRQHGACIEARRWPAQVMNTIEAYAGSTDTYWFPKVGEALQAFERHFTPREIHYSEVELGNRCPLFVLERSA